MEPPSTGKITIVNESGRRIRTSPLIKAAQTALSRHGMDGEVCILLTDDAALAELNRRFRSLDEPTDVLTFPAGNSSIVGSEPLLGDIAISVDYAERQAAARGVSLSQELGYLAIHGALHLAGFDDETESDRAEMMTEMNRVAQASGLKADPEWASILHGVER
jgi:rRNA maturation RNase YbeY